MSEDIIVRFVADRANIKPVKKDGELSVELFTGIYSVPMLGELFLWQAQDSTFEVTIRRISPELAGTIVRGKNLQRNTMEEGMVGEESV